MGSLKRIGKPGKAALLLAVGAAGGGAALAVGAVPDGNGVIHACVQTLTATGQPIVQSGNVRIIDPSAGQTCNPGNAAGGPPGEATLNWNMIGPRGADGPPGSNGTAGTPGKNAIVANGHTITLSGGDVITVNGGNTLTISSPPIDERGHGIGQVTISGNTPLSFDVFALGFTGGTHASGGGGGGGRAGKVALHDISITKVVDAASPKLFLYCANGKHIPKVTITLRKAGKIYQTIKLSDVLVSSFQTSGHGSGGTLPLNTVSFNFTKIEIDNKPPK